MIVRFEVMGEGLVRGKYTEFVWRVWDEGWPIPRVGERVWLRRWGGENEGEVYKVEWQICDGADKKNCDLAEHCADCGIDVTVWLKAVDDRPKKKQAKRSPNPKPTTIRELIAANAQGENSPVAQTPRDVSELYHELLYAVSRKFPGESRHETALRYIRNAENETDKSDPVSTTLEVRI